MPPTSAFFHPLQDNERETRDALPTGAADASGVAVGGEQSGDVGKQPDGTGEKVDTEVEQAVDADAMHTNGDTMHTYGDAMHTDDDVTRADNAHPAVGDEERVGGDGEQAYGDGDGEVDASAVSGVDDEANAEETVAPPVSVPNAAEWGVKSDAIARRLSQIHEV